MRGWCPLHITLRNSPRHYAPLRALRITTQVTPHHSASLRITAPHHYASLPSLCIIPHHFASFRIFRIFRIRHITPLLSFTLHHSYSRHSLPVHYLYITTQHQICGTQGKKLTFALVTVTKSFDDIETWRNEFLVQSRTPYPPPPFGLFLFL